jgi:hypothetical protein
MKKQIIITLILFSTMSLFAQGKSIVLTVKTTITGIMSAETLSASSELIVIDENGASSVINLPDIFKQTLEHETALQVAINKITMRNFKLVDCTLTQYGTMPKYWIFTRYIFTENI